MKVAKFGLLVVVAILGFALLGSSPASAYIYPSAGDSLIVSPGIGGRLGGGEFNVNIVGKGGDVDFISFCVETNEHLTYGGTFIVGAITDAAVAGGSGGAVGGSDPLDPRTAFLYTRFINGGLPFFDYESEEDANDLQAAIWYIEQEVAPYGVNNQWVTFANFAVAPGGAWEGLGIGNVRVINLQSVAGGPRQDILTLNPEIIPEPSMMLLFGSGMLGLAFAARKRFFKK